MNTHLNKIVSSIEQLEGRLDLLTTKEGY